MGRIHIGSGHPRNPNEAGRSGHSERTQDEQCRPDRCDAAGRRNEARLRNPERQCAAPDGGDAHGGPRFRAHRARRLGGICRRCYGAHVRRAGLMHRHAWTGRHESRDRRRLRLSGPFAADRHNLQSQHRTAGPAHPDVDRPPCAVRPDHQGDIPPAARPYRRNAHASDPHRPDRAARAGPSRSAGGRGAGPGDRKHRPAGPARCYRAATPGRAGGRRDRPRRRPHRGGQTA